MDYKITINTFPSNSFNISSWNLIHQDEPERITVKKGNKEYALVFDDELDQIRLEIWSLDNGELKEIEETKYLNEVKSYIFS